MKSEYKTHVQYLFESWPDAEYAGFTLPGWYFWNEVQTSCYGPYLTQEEACRALDRYN